MQDWKQQFSSPSRLDTFAMYLTGKYWGRKDPNTEEDIEFTDELFIAELLKKFEKTPEMEAGTALHKLLELSSDGELTNMIGINGKHWLFQFNIDISLSLLPLREIKFSKVLNGISINSIIDNLGASMAADHKFTKQINYDKYINSWQGKIYLWILGNKINTFKYNVFQGKVLPETFEPHIHHVRIDKFESIIFERYNNMDKEVEDFYYYYWEVLEKLKLQIIDAAIKNNIVIKDI